MPTYNVTYSCTEYFEKEYEADSDEDAMEMFDDDPDKYTYNSPYSSQHEFVDITEV